MDKNDKIMQRVRELLEISDDTANRFNQIDYAKYVPDWVKKSILYELIYRKPVFSNSTDVLYYSYIDLSVLPFLVADFINDRYDVYSNNDPVLFKATEKGVYIEENALHSNSSIVSVFPLWEKLRDNFGLIVARELDRIFYSHNELDRMFNLIVRSGVIDLSFTTQTEVPQYLEDAYSNMKGTDVLSGINSLEEYLGLFTLPEENEKYLDELSDILFKYDIEMNIQDAVTNDYIKPFIEDKLFQRWAPQLTFKYNTN